MKQLEKNYFGENSLVLFGGSFDPVQNAHVGIVQNLSERFGRVTVIPGFISPFKKNAYGAASAGLRLAMLKAALPEKENVAVSDFELVKGGVSYTVDTVLHFKAENPDSPLYFAIGADMLAKLGKWHRIDELKESVTFYMIGRPGFTVRDATVRRLQKSGIRLVRADFTGGEASSAEARVDAAFGEFGSVPAAAAKIIQKEGLYREFEPIVGAFETFGLSKERIGHIHRTAKAAITLAKIHGANVTDAITAALLHDITKDASDGLLQKLGIGVPEDIAAVPAKVRHAFTGAAAAKSYFKVRKKAVLDAIYYHTTGAPRMGKLAKVIYLADMTEDGREEFEGLSELRALCKTKLNAALTFALACVIRRLGEQNREVYYLTADAYDFYLNGGKKSADAGEQGLYDADAAKAEKKRSTPVAAYPLNPKELAREIAKCLSDKKGRDITLIDLQNKTIIADYFVIASVGSTTRSKAF